MNNRTAAAGALSLTCCLVIFADGGGAHTHATALATPAPAQARRAAPFPAPAAPEAGRFLVESFGARGDGKADDTAAIQAAVDAAGAAGGGAVVFRGGATYLVTSVDVPPGITLDGNGATVRRPDRTPGKFTRMFTTQRRPWISDDDSAVLVVRDLTLDGNRRNQGDYDKYELEHAHLLFLMGAQAPEAKRGRLRALVQNCTFKDSPADGLSVFTNVSVRVTDCAAYECFRGGVTVTGGHSVIDIRGFAGSGDRHRSGLHYEVDGAGFGGSTAIESVIAGAVLDGDFSCGLAPGSTFVAGNVVCRGPAFNVYAPGSRVSIHDSAFVMGVQDGYANRIVHPGDVTFSNCRFTVTESAEPGAPEVDRRFAAAGVTWNISGTAHKGLRLRLVNCVFAADGTLEPADTAYAIYTTPDAPENDNRLIVEGGEVSPAFDFGLYVSQGGRAAARGTRIAADTGVFLGAPAGFAAEVELDGVTASGRTSLHVGNPNDRSVITHRNARSDEAHSALETTYGLAGGTAYRGGRIIDVDSDPTARLSGLTGDRARLKTPAAGRTYEWVCTAAGVGAAATWKAVAALGD